MNGMKVGERNLMLLFLGLSVAAAVLSLGFQLPEARNFPLVVGIGNSLLITAYFVVMAVPRLRQVFRPFIEDDIFMRVNEAAEGTHEPALEGAVDAATHPPALDDAERQRRELILIGYIVAFGVVGYFVGLTIAAPLFIVAVMIGFAGESLILSITVALGTSAFLHLMFTIVLKLPPHYGVLG